MSNHWIILDCHSLCHRLWHKMPSLTHEDIGVNVVFGFLRDIRSFQNKFMSKAIVFAWDVGPFRRKTFHPDYKLRPVEQDQEVLEARNELQRQINLLREEYIPQLGYLNNFWYAGYEADDIIASVCLDSIDEEDEVTIVSSDHDLYQLLTERVKIFHPVTKQMITQKTFKAEWGIRPTDWPRVKAMAGCNSDNVPGIEGVGEKTAAKYLRGELSVKTKTYQRIISTRGFQKQNLELVQLPFAYTPSYILKEDWLESVTEEKWRKLTVSLGMDSLSGKRKGIFT